ncbi:MAG: DUF2782 domain-containing protein [Salinicola sp.]|uniref:DUF2782 domain-containing protein n=1 Tax=Salinicola sp. TaxID=1978524 RepID=UPI001D224AB5|nr:DUF2782 domain-containing protein [Salinicola sp.]NRB57191.1 DUF2782 domain-containing protein [Salinicola sp.]
MSRWPRKTSRSRTTAPLASLLLALLIAGSALPALAQPAEQPSITSQQDGQRTIDEYRVNGKLYAIRIVPADGKPYFLYDNNGDGDFSRVEASSVAVPAWVIQE